MNTEYQKGYKAGYQTGRKERKIKIIDINADNLIGLIYDNPFLPIIPMIDGEVVGDDCGYWMGKWGPCEVTEYYIGRERVHFKDDDEEEVLTDLQGCKYGCNAEGKDVYDLSDEEWDELYKSVPWTRAIVVYITT